MGYVQPAETVTLLDGFEEEADSLIARQKEASELMARPQGKPQALDALLRQQRALQQLQQQQGSSQAGAAAGGTGGSTAAPALDPAAERVRRQMQQAYLRTQQLRTMIEWGRDAMGRYHEVGPAWLPSELQYAMCTTGSGG